MNQPSLDEEAIFEAARRLSPAERVAFLKARCGGNSELERRLASLLRASEGADEFFEEGAAALNESAQLLTVTEQAGDRIDRYRLLQQIGEGGSGLVYMSEQEQPVRRRVALKIIKLGMDTRNVVARFDAERQALAMMDHPNIAKVLDAGATATGRPYFVMELVRGLKITEFCDEHYLPTRERLKLFIEVCHAVQHAHQKGIIHRDLKPSNILVTLNDGAAVPKVIDFGIAKAIQGRLTDQTLFTAFEQLLGTPAYMSPEQALMTSVDIDTRSDIYSLGVLLYELLTGKTPFDTQDLLAAGLDELRQTILEKEPLRPSTRLESMPGQELTTTAAKRRSDAPKLIHLLHGDLDWIVMKCLEKDRSRRYQTAIDLGADVQRHLNNLPVAARPPSALYRFGKFVRRRRVVFSLGISLLLAISVGTILSTRSALRARRAEAEAKENLWASYIAQAQASRWSRLAGRRSTALELLKNAAQYRPSLGLRNEAIACMAVADLHVLYRRKAVPAGGHFGSFDANCERYVFADDQDIVHLCRTQDSTELAQFPGYAAPFNALGFSPDGRVLFVAGDKGGNCLEFIDLVDKKPILNLSVPYFLAVDVNTDGRLAVVSARQETNGLVRVFDLAVRREISSFRTERPQYSIHFDPLHTNLVTMHDGSENVDIWDWEAKRKLRTFTHPARVNGVQWSRDGQFVATASDDHKVRLWDLATGLGRALFSGHEWPVTHVGFSPNGDFLFSQDQQGVLRLWDALGQHEIVNQSFPGTVRAFSGSGNRFGICDEQGKVTVVETSPGDWYGVLRTDMPNDGSPVACDFSFDGHLLVSSHEHTTRLWDLRTRRQILRFPGESQRALIRFHPNGTNVIICTAQAIENWVLRARTSNMVEVSLQQRWTRPSQGRPLHFDRKGNVLVRANNGIRMLDPVSGQESLKLNLTNSFEAALSPDGRYVATWIQHGGNVQIQDLSNPRNERLLSAHSSPQVVFSPNDDLLVVADRVEVRAWNMLTWESLYALPRESGGLAYPTFSQDGQLLAIAISSALVRLVDPKTGRELATLQAPNPVDVHSITFSHDDTRLAVVGGGSIHVWNLSQIRRQLIAMNLNWADSDPIGMAVERKE